MKCLLIPATDMFAALHPWIQSGAVHCRNIYCHISSYLLSYLFSCCPHYVYSSLIFHAKVWCVH